MALQESEREAKFRAEGPKVGSHDKEELYDKCVREKLAKIP